MAKKPTPKKRLSKDRSNRRHSVYLQLEVKRLTDLAASPFSGPVAAQNKVAKALKNITKIKA
jgi:hypothetical protein